jgi:predicted peptidase
MRIQFLTLLLILMCCVFVVDAQESTKTEEASPWQKRVLPDATGKLPAGLPYRLFVPKDYDAAKQYPLIVYLHGAGERGVDNEKHIARNGAPKLISDAVQAKTPCFVIAPQCPPDRRWVEVNWGEKESHQMPEQPSEPMRLLLQLLDELPKEFSLDPQRFYLTGLSMGGFGAWDLLARRPQLFAAAIPICGGADNTTALRIKHIPLWTFHGDKDTVVWPQRTRTMVEALKAADGNVKYTEYAGVGHNSWDKAYAEPELFDWLFSHRAALPREQ